jgi:purine-binding chemotaxis protein CheW
MQRFKYALAENWAVQSDYFSRPLDPVRKPVAPAGAIAAGADASSRTPWLLCRAGTHLCAVPIGHVIEIMRVLPIEAISGAPSYVRGLCIMRGAPVPVVDIGLLVGDQPSRSGRLVAIRAGSRTIAFVVETVESIQTIGPEALNHLPPLLRDAATAAIAAIGTLDAELLLFLRTTRIIPDDVLARLDADGAAT